MNSSHYNSMNTPEELLQAYTALFIFLGGSVSMSPEESGLPHICDSGLLRNLPVESHNPTYERASQLLRSPCPFKQQCRLTVGSNYNSLLADDKSAYAYPAASRWKISGKTAEEHHALLGKLYAQYGYSRSEECGLEPDHLGIELLFVNLLLEKYLTEDDSTVKKIIRNDLFDFVSGEMLSWLPLWAEEVSAKSVTKCYTGIAGLIIGALEDVKDILSDQKLGL
ncbi:MAG: molecular chaperone TorD family protein [Bacteroidales bacterium]|nr:molecular chaperone TorD family protein [Bacteroidales bacterium]